MTETAPQFTAVAFAALQAYGLADGQAEFIRHSDTVTYRIKTHRSTALLRIHRPVSAAMGDHGLDVNAVRSEMQWLEALSLETVAPVQHPLRNLQGELVTRVQLEPQGQVYHCTLLSWLEGQPYLRELESAETAAQIGAITGLLHRHSRNWQLPAGFTRPRRDSAYFERVLAALQPAVADGRISRSDYHQLQRSVELLLADLASQPPDPAQAGLMHADIHKGNLLIHNGKIRLIDFSFCAFGPYCFDLAICCSDMQPQFHRAFLQAYQRLYPLQPGYRRLVEGLFIGSMVGTFSYWAANPHAAEWLARKVPQVVQNYAASYNAGAPFWFLDEA